MFGHLTPIPICGVYGTVSWGGLCKARAENKECIPTPVGIGWNSGIDEPTLSRLAIKYYMHPLAVEGRAYS